MDRMTKKSIGAFEYDLKDHVHKTGEFNDYDAFFAYSNAVKRLGELEDANEPMHIDDWHEDDGDCLWWYFPIQEPPYCGNPLDMNFPNYVTHFTRIIIPFEPNI